MTTLDWMILAATLLFAVAGYFRGFIVGVLSLSGFVAGAIAGTRLADALLAGTAGAILALGLEGVGVRLRRGLRLPFLGVVDGVLGALLSATLALGIAWVLGAVVLALPGTGSLRAEVRRSAILRRLDELMPPSGVVLNALARIDPLPAIAGGTQASTTTASWRAPISRRVTISAATAVPACSATSKRLRAAGSSSP